MTEDGQDLRVEAEVPHQPSGLGWLPDGRLLVVSMRDRKLLRREPDGDLVVHADLADHVSGHPNDMVVDDAGSRLRRQLRLRPDGRRRHRADASCCASTPTARVTTVAEDLWFPNGSVITDDGVLLVDETFGNRVSAFDIQPDGSLGTRRDWATLRRRCPPRWALGEALPGLVVAPDGCGARRRRCPVDRRRG